MRVCSLPFLLLFAGIAVADDRPTPKYEGKPLDYWVAKLENPADDKERDLATKALEAFSKDAAPAIPKLLVMLEDKSSTYRYQVQRVFMAMKVAAAPAVPTLMKRLEEGSCADPQGAMEILASIGPEAKAAVPVLAKIVTTDEELAGWAVRTLGAIGPDGAKDAVPAVMKMLRDHPDRVRYFWDDLAKLKGTIVPGFIELLAKPPYGLDVWDVVRTLGKIGPEAKAAVPALKKLLLSADELKSIQTEYDDARKPQARERVFTMPTDEQRVASNEATERRKLGFEAALAVAKIDPCPEVLEAMLVRVRTGRFWDGSEEAEVFGRLGEESALPTLKRRLAEDREMRSECEDMYRTAIKALEAKKRK